jgi:hypothetical protein
MIFASAYFHPLRKRGNFEGYRSYRERIDTRIERKAFSFFVLILIGQPRKRCKGDRDVDSGRQVDSETERLNDIDKELHIQREMHAEVERHAEIERCIRERDAYSEGERERERNFGDMQIYIKRVRRKYTEKSKSRESVCVKV